MIARARAEPRLPLDAIVAAVTKDRRAGARDRRELGDLVFAWARRRGAIEPRIQAALRERGGLRPQARDLDRVALAVAALESGLDAETVSESLSSVARELVDDVAARAAATAALPAWLVERLSVRRDPGVPCDVLCASLLERAPVVLAVDARAAPDEIIAALSTSGVRAVPSPVAPRALRIVEGRYSAALLPVALRAHVWPMDDASQAVALAARPPMGGVVLDVCAGGGGKSRLLAALGATVISADSSRERLSRSVARGNARVVADARHAPFLARSMSRILVDAPCSGSGTLRRAPDVAHRLKPEDVDAAVALQRSILLASAALLAPAGTLVYATCSLLPEENEGVIDWVLRTSTDLAPTPLAPLWGDEVHGVPAAACGHTFLPARDGCDGFFVAALTRRR